MVTRSPRPGKRQCIEVATMAGRSISNILPLNPQYILTRSRVHLYLCIIYLRPSVHKGYVTLYSIFNGRIHFPHKDSWVSPLLLKLKQLTRSTSILPSIDYYAPTKAARGQLNLASPCWCTDNLQSFQGQVTSILAQQVSVPQPDEIKDESDHYDEQNAPDR